jgi:hypothetical protein
MLSLSPLYSRMTARQAKNLRRCLSTALLVIVLATTLVSMCAQRQPVVWSQHVV